MRELRIGGPVPLGDRLDDLFFEGLVGEDRESLFDVVFFADERLPFSDDLAHLALDHRQVLFGKVPATRQLEVVVEAVGDRRTDREMRAGIQAQHGLGHHVCGRVADDVASLAGIPRHDAHAIAVVKRRAQVDECAVHLRRDRVLREPSSDRRSEIGDCRAVVEFAR